MEKEALITNFLQELRRGLLVLCVLANLKEPAYGYSLIEKLKNSDISIEANTLYPLLRRLEGQMLLTSMWDTNGVKPRKYYVLTDFGNEILYELKFNWQKTTQSINEILLEVKE